MLPTNVLSAIKSGPIPKLRDWRSLPNGDLTRGERVCRFIETFLKIPEGNLVGQPFRLMPFQECFVQAIYDNKSGTYQALLGIGRKNGKSSVIAAICLAHIVGPEARQNSQIVSGARSREQAALVFKLMQKMISLSSELRKITHIIPSQKAIIGKRMNVEYRAISAEAGTAHGLSCALAILDEIGQIKGPNDDFVEAIVTSQGAYDDPLLVAISTQAPTDNDLFSRWLDDAETSRDPKIVCHLYTAPEDCDLMDRDAWLAANPAMGVFRSVNDLEEKAKKADRLPTEQNSFRWLYLNQRIDATAPFISRKIWMECGREPRPLQPGAAIYGGLDLSEVNDLTALVLVSPVDGDWHVYPTFWLPENGLREKSKADRVPYDVWHKEGHLNAIPGPSINYEYVAHELKKIFDDYDVRKIAFDRWNWRHLKPWLERAGFNDKQLDGDAAIFEPFGQGYQSMSPALRDLETVILNRSMAHGGHPVLNMCMANATVQADPAGNRKLSKVKSHGRIDGAVALAMAMSVAGTWEDKTVDLDDFLSSPVMVI